MINDPNDKNPDPLARRQIPDVWGQSGRCPACQAAPLQVVHLANATDYLICSECELSFEVAASGGKIRIKNVPEALGFMEVDLRYQWVEPSLLGNFVSNRLALMAQKAKTAVPGSLSDAEVRKRSRSLYRMGNKPKMVEFILIQAGATPEQAQAAFVKLKQQSEQDAQDLARKFRLAGAILFFIIFAAIAGWALAINMIGAQLRQELANPRGAAKQAILPLQLLNNLPDGIKPGFLKFLPVSVRNTGPGPATCPDSSSGAAGLFGGAANQWLPLGQAPGWQMVTIGAPSTIRVPAEMQAALVDNKTGELSIFNGPVTMNNINFVAILCD